MLFAGLFVQLEAIKNGLDMEFGRVVIGVVG